MADASSGALVWTPFLEQAALSLGSAVVGWALAFVAAISCQTNEIAISRRLIRITNGASLVLAAACLGVLVMEAMTLRRLSWPHLGMVLPILHLSLTMLSACVNSHVCFRWVQLALQPVAIVMHALAAAQESVQADCLENATCVSTAGAAPGWSLTQLYQLRWLRFVACMASLWVVLGSGYLAVSLGWCWPRYSPRLFSEEHPLSALPVRKGREHRTAEAQGTTTALRRAEAAARARAHRGSKGHSRGGGSTGDVAIRVRG
ncbi:hypothetical protein FNF27_01648 [Cafeteria roenbergensis]|uniref:Uncharacterized protein n=1 Tax=Cafeteria roenbergensis TaxID=33653 RepID=A0A5A8DT01_CAFRO|nr:hypothetical protein FNF29_03946 [Cafeteria roenbergensis]KAA0167824.1 hypothetical protein FNF31_00759 [Cafeteria roenbergensis]KAA0171633.1 hypothetical protein FNF28_00566 [Cafeteria roenbergensis]KAA0176826.1 hypothetical protein FNF27_01648 [Cafeteria roenbergensis]|eukprot:KAA0152380.1 hypothetical protein FNF29_03946 [Cafeteria roenbergensis]